MTRPRTNPVTTRVWTYGRFFLVVAGLCATFAAFFLAGMRVTTQAREVEVPNLQGKSVVEARALLTGKGLVLRIDEVRRADKTVAADHVLSQEPAAGEVVRRQRAIRVRLSDGQRAPAVPSVVDLPERTAEITLDGEQVAIGTRAEIRSLDYRPGAVVAQNPPARERASSVDLLINRGDGSLSYVVPDLIGSLAVRTTEVLRGLGFRVAVAAEVPYPGLPPGVVIRQTPQPGFQIMARDTITLEVTR